MARAGVTYHDIAKAATQLSQQDKVPTVDAVREVLGTGSKSTIAPFLKDWKAKQAGMTDVEQAGLPSELFASVKGIYEGIQLQAEDRIEAIQTQARVEVEEANQALFDTQKSNADLALQLKNSETAIEQCELLNQSLQNELKQEQRALLAAKTQQEALQLRLEDRNQEITRLSTQLEQAQQNLDHYRDSVQKQREQERADFDRQLLNLEQALKLSQVENQSLRHNLGRVENEVTKVATERDQLQSSNNAFNEQTRQQSKAIEQLQLRLKEIEARYELALQSNKTFEAKVQSLEELARRLEKQIAVSQDKIQALSATNNSAKAKIEALRNDNSILMQEKANIEGQFKQLQRSLYIDASDLNLI